MNEAKRNSLIYEWRWSGIGLVAGYGPEAISALKLHFNQFELICVALSLVELFFIKEETSEAKHKENERKGSMGRE